jgi:hypothetical protein
MRGVRRKRETPENAPGFIRATEDQYLWTGAAAIASNV